MTQMCTCGWSLLYLEGHSLRCDTLLVVCFKIPGLLVLRRICCNGKASSNSNLKLRATRLGSPAGVIF